MVTIAVMNLRKFICFYSDGRTSKNDFDMICETCELVLIYRRKVEAYDNLAHLCFG